MIRYWILIIFSCCFNKSIILKIIFARYSATNLYAKTHKDFIAIYFKVKIDLFSYHNIINEIVELLQVFFVLFYTFLEIELKI